MKDQGVSVTRKEKELKRLKQRMKHVQGRLVYYERRKNNLLRLIQEQQKIKH